ncbi:hypothetical protein ACQVPL_22270 [Bacillus hominis]|uniref:hypothetical protein n=1 Tax=Bacillus hominis TaxID=2817478 RepID=UPI003D6614C2
MKHKEQLFEALKIPEVLKCSWRKGDLGQILMIAVNNKKGGKHIPFIAKRSLL